MRQGVRDWVEMVSNTLPVLQPVCEFGAWQSQPGLSDLRPFFPGKQYVGCDIRQGPGVDVLVDLHDTGLASESVGTLLLLETLEHVQYPFKAMEEIYRILKRDGIALLSSVMNYPIHDSHDYWRFTPEAFHTLLKGFPLSFVEFAGDPSFPPVVVGIGVKGRLRPETVDLLQSRLARWKLAWEEESEASPAWGQTSNWKQTLKLLTPPLILKGYHRLRRIH